MVVINNWGITAENKLVDDVKNKINHNNVNEIFWTAKYIFVGFCQENVACN